MPGRGHGERTRGAWAPGRNGAAGTHSAPAAFRIPAVLLDAGLAPILRKVDEERSRYCVHEPVDFAELALQQLDEHPRDEAGTDADGDVVGQRHEDDGQESRQAILDVCDVDVLDEREHLSLIHISEPTRLGMISYAV